MNTRNIRFRSNRVRDILALYHDELDSLYGRGEMTAFAEMLFSEFLGWDRVRLLLGKEQTVDQSDLLRFHWALEDLKKCRPIQHIIGYVDFRGCRIEVDPNVLIPRPETEEMVRALISNFESGISNHAFENHNSTFKILDLCTGSGCIAIALKNALPQAEVAAVDISSAALAVARRNAAANGTDITFVMADILDPNYQPPMTNCQLIVSNPPYVRDTERAAMRPNVLDHEPLQALFVPDNDPLLFYRAIAAVAQRCLAPDGMVAVEINEALAADTCALFVEKGLNATIHTDFRGKPRWITASRAGGTLQS